MDGSSDGGMSEKLALLPHLIRMKGLLNHHITSFDQLVDVEMERVLLNESNIEIRSSVDSTFFIRYLGIRVLKPQETSGMGMHRPLSPHECRQRDATYRGEIRVDIEYATREWDPSCKGKRRVAIAENILIGHMPIMIRSKHCNLYGLTGDALIALRECPLDPGGYFVVRGVEKVCLVQEQQSKNRIIIEADDHNNIIAHVQSKTHYSISKCTVQFKRGYIVMQHRSFIEDIPIIIVLKALGFESDQEIVEHIGAGPVVEAALYPCFEQASLLHVVTTNDALAYIGEHRKDFVTDDAQPNAADVKSTRSSSDQAAEFLGRVLLCHVREGEIPMDWNMRQKAVYVCIMVRRLIEASHDSTLLDNRDFYGNKRFETAGTLMGLLFEDLLKVFNRHVKVVMDQHLSKADTTRPMDPATFMDRKNIITHGFQTALSTGRWELRRFNMSRHGVTQVLSRLSYVASLGMMTRLASSFEKTRKVSGPRSLQPSQWGMVCPCDTPEGESCGLVKNFALLSQVTLDEDEAPVRRAAHAYGVEEIDAVGPRNLLYDFAVFLNGKIIGTHRSPNRLCKALRMLRRSGKLHAHMSVYVQTRQRCVHIGCDGGRITRLYIIVSNGKSAVTHQDLRDLNDGLIDVDWMIKNSKLEYVDVNESNDCYIAIRENDINADTTHVEVDPVSILGVVAGVIPYPHHNQSARNTFQCAMGKQAMGGIGYNQSLRVDSVLLLGVYPQRPLCRTTSMDFTDYEKLGAGINAMVCVMSYSGYDIEDAQVYNRGSIDRGYGRCIVLRKHEVPIRSNETIEPPPTLGMRAPSRQSRYAALSSAGIASVGAVVDENMILVNKYTQGGDRPRPTPVTYALPTPSVVDHVYITHPDAEATRGDDVTYIVKVVTREVRIPELGDKFSSRHGQKGVVGLITDEMNMPFNEEGMKPDMIMNPHGFPSRMTVGKLMELMSSKSAVLRGTFGDGTAFAGDDVEFLCRSMVQHGYHFQGKDLFYSGITGEPLPGYVFFGPIFYQRLKHMVIDKMHARSTGPRSLLTRQPTEGRARHGGLRVGEMERDCMVGYGTANVLRERLLVSSDMYSLDICSRCGHMAYNNTCASCRSSGKLSKVTLPYAFKLLLQELLGIGINVRLTVESVKEPLVNNLA